MLPRSSPSLSQFHHHHCSNIIFTPPPSPHHHHHFTTTTTACTGHGGQDHRHVVGIGLHRPDSHPGQGDRLQGQGQRGTRASRQQVGCPLVCLRPCLHQSVYLFYSVCLSGCLIPSLFIFIYLFFHPSSKNTSIHPQEQQ